MPYIQDESKPCVERQWSLHGACLDGIHHQFLRATTSEGIDPELLLIATGALRLLFLYGVSEAPDEAHARTKAVDCFDRAFLLGMFGLLYDKAFKAWREFLTNVHYTYHLENEPTALSITDTSLLYGVFKAPQEAHARTRVEDMFNRAFLLRMSGLLYQIRSQTLSHTTGTLERHTLRRGLWILKYILDRLERLHAE
jgi:hypothetical protein